MNNISDREEFAIAASTQQSISVFDLDGTLTLRDTFLPFVLSYGMKNRRYWALCTFWIPCLLYVCKFLKDQDAKEKLLVRFFANEPIDRIDAHAEWFCQTWLPRHINHTVLEKLKASQTNGNRVVILSASPDLYVPSIAKRFGVSEVVCTQVSQAGGDSLGKLAGPNCKGPNKVKLLNEYLKSETNYTISAAYGDSRHDLEILRLAEAGWLVKQQQLTRVNTTR